MWNYLIELNKPDRFTQNRTKNPIKLWKKPSNSNQMPHRLHRQMWWFQFHYTMKMTQSMPNNRNNSNKTFQCYSKSCATIIVRTFLEPRFNWFSNNNLAAMLLLSSTNVWKSWEKKQNKENNGRFKYVISIMTTNSIYCWCWKWYRKWRI